MASPDSLRIYLLGRFEISYGEHILLAAAWTRHKAAILLQRLAFERRLLKEQVIEFLWPEQDPTTGANNLYRTFHALRQTLDKTLGKGVAEATFAFHDGVLTLVDNVWVDVAAFELLSQSNNQTDLMEALHLYAGDFLPDERYAEWTLVPRAKLFREQRKVRLRLASRFREEHRFHEAITLLTPLLTQDQADEVVHRELMTLYASVGHRHEALRQYQTCVEALAAELGVSPDAQTAALYTRIVNGSFTPLLFELQPVLTTSAPMITEGEYEVPLVGRQSDLETLLRRLQSNQSSGQVLLLAGDSGVGKTRLALEALRTLSDSSAMILNCAANEQEGQLPYQPFIEAFDRYLIEHQLPSQEHPITHFKRLGVSDPQREQWALFNTVVAFLLRLAAKHQVVLFIDDLHAADETSLQLFHHLARQTRAAPVTLMATYRTDLIAPLTAPFGTLLNALYRAHLSETLNLAPLSKRNMVSIISCLLGGQVSLPLMEEMFAITEGNPFFVQEITSLVLKSGQVQEHEGQWQLKPGVDLSVPMGLAGLLHERISRLGPPVETALKTASVVGREFRFEVLRRLVPLSEGELLDALDEALGSHLLEETADGYSFHHPLTRRALYDALSRERRMQLHTRTAEAIEVTYAERHEGLSPFAEVLAYHYEHSTCRDRALPYLLQSGKKAAHLLAFEVAMSYFERALALMDEFKMDDPARRWKILQALGWWGFILGDTLRAVEHIEQALAFLPGQEWQPEGCDEARLHEIAAVLLVNAGKMTEAENHLQTAIARIKEQEDAVEYAHAYYNFALFYWHQGEFQKTLEASQKSLAIAKNIDDSLSIARAYEMLALAYHSLGEWQFGLDLEQQRWHLTDSELDVTEYFDIHLCLWEYQLYGDHEYDEVKQMVTATLKQAQRMGAARAVALCQCFNGALEYQSGHWTNAEASLRTAIQLYRQIGAAFGESLSCQRLGELLTAKGRIEEGLTILQEGLAAAERALVRAHCLTRLYASLVRNRLAAGDLLAADEALTLGLAMSERHGNCSTCFALLLPSAISLRVAQSNLSAALRICQQLDQAAAKYGSQMWVAMAWQAHGELGAAQGELEEALNAYEEALHGYRLAGNEYEVARCLAAIAAIHLTRNADGDAKVAQQEQEEAQQIYERLVVV